MSIEKKKIPQNPWWKELMDLEFARGKFFMIHHSELFILHPSFCPREVFLLCSSSYLKVGYLVRADCLRSLHSRYADSSRGRVTPPTFRHLP